MAGFFQQALKGAATGFFNDAYLRDFKHASKTFTTDGFANAPKFKYLFHVYFELNETLTGSVFSDPIIPGLLVKNITLPKFSVTVAEMNQYNRRRNVQTKIAYDPISITLHDDNRGSILKMWHNYYSYYYNDATTISKFSNNPEMISGKNLYVEDISQNQNWGYSGEPSASNGASATGITKPNFFKSIKIYGFEQHNFTLYTLLNPMIERFEHDTYDYYQPTGVMENRMTLRYEGVQYSKGAINGQNPADLVSGFGTDAYYDRTLSPISRPGGNKSIMGQGGLVDAGTGILDDLSKIPPDIGGVIAKTLNVANTWKNPKSILTAAKSELLSQAKTAAAGAIAGAAIGGIASASGAIKAYFPSPGASTTGAGAQQSASNNTKDTQAPPVR